MKKAQLAASALAKALGLAGIGFLLVSQAFAAQPANRYTETLRKEPYSSGGRNFLNHFLVYPFELIRWPMDQSIDFTEKHHLDKKAQWLYEEIQDYGITPKANLVSFSHMGAGADIDFVRLARLKEEIPDGVVKGWVNWTRNVIFETGAEVGMERIAGTSFNTFGFVNYENRPEEHFYGIGPQTSMGDGTSYRMEQTMVEGRTGYKWVPSLSLDVKYGYKNVNITNGEDGGRGIIDRIFPLGSVPGLAGDELFHTGVEFQHDTRNYKESSTRGGHERLAWSFVEGVDDSNARYFKYETEATRYIPLKSERRVLALHYYGEHNDSIGEHYVPFHQMAKLGGYGTYPRLSHTLRSFDSNRFFDESAVLFNIEYRYTVWEYRDMKLDGVLFFDEGQVFGEFSEFQFSDFREAYGVGVRFHAANHVLLSVEFAHGDEGSSVYVKSGKPF